MQSFTGNKYYVCIQICMRECVLLIVDSFGAVCKERKCNEIFSHKVCALYLQTQSRPLRRRLETNPDGQRRKKILINIRVVYKYPVVNDYRIVSVASLAYSFSNE